MTLEEHIINCLPLLIGNMYIVDETNIVFHDKTGIKVKCEKESGKSYLYISEKFESEMYTLFNIDRRFLYKVISTYLGMNLIPYYEKFKQNFTLRWDRNVEISS
jgi:hypothetical protein